MDTQDTHEEQLNTKDKLNKIWAKHPKEHLQSKYKWPVSTHKKELTSH